jgi:hypothetical protein
LSFVRDDYDDVAHSECRIRQTFLDGCLQRSTAPSRILYRVSSLGSRTSSSGQSSIVFPQKSLQMATKITQNVRTNSSLFSLFCCSRQHHITIMNTIKKVLLFLLPLVARSSSAFAPVATKRTFVTKSPVTQLHATPPTMVVY